MSEENFLDRLNHVLSRESIVKLMRRYTRDDITPIADLYKQLQNNTEFEKYIQDNCRIEDINDPSNPFSTINLLKKEIKQFTDMWNAYIQNRDSSMKRIFDENQMQAARLKEAQNTAEESIRRCFVQLTLYIALLDEKIQVCNDKIKSETEKIAADKNLIVDIFKEHLSKLDFSEELGAEHSLNLIQRLINFAEKYIRENPHVEFENLKSTIMNVAKAFLQPLRVLESEKDIIVNKIANKLLAINSDLTGAIFGRIDHSLKAVEHASAISTKLTESRTVASEKLKDLTKASIDYSNPLLAEKSLKSLSGEANKLFNSFKASYDKEKLFSDLDNLIQDKPQIAHKL